jgi:ABC-type uncharacterized transport system permease subunit
MTFDQILSIIYQLVQSTYMAFPVLLIVALGGLISERSGVTNIALEGIMIFGAFVGIWAIKGLEVFPYSPLTIVVIGIVSFIFSISITWIIRLLLNYFNFKIPNLIYIAFLMIVGIVLTLIISRIPVRNNFLLIMGFLIGGSVGGLYSMIHAYASIYLKSNQIISATALNIFAPAFAVFTARILQDGGGQQISFRTNFQIKKVGFLGDIPVIGDLFFKNTYLTVFLALALFVIITVTLFKTKFGLRLRACGENPHAADSLGVNIYRLRFIAVSISGVLAGIGGVGFIVATSSEFNVTVAGFGFLSLAVLIFGNWRPKGIILAALFFGFMRTLAASYGAIPFLSNLRLPEDIYNAIPYFATLVILAFFSKNSRVPKALGQIYDQGKR